MRKRPCRFCRRWFASNRRVGERQRACSSIECQKKRRAATQALWRRKNPDYFIRWRIERRQKQGRRDPLQVSRPLKELPWDVAQEEFDERGADFLAHLGRVLVVHVQDEIKAQVIDFVGLSGGLPLRAAKDAIGAQVSDFMGVTGRLPP